MDLHYLIQRLIVREKCTQAFQNIFDRAGTQDAVSIVWNRLGNLCFSNLRCSNLAVGMSSWITWSRVVGLKSCSIYKTVGLIDSVSCWGRRESNSDLWIVGWRIGGVEPRALARWGVIDFWQIKGIEPIWAGPGVIVCCLSLSMGFIYSSTEEVSCWGIGDSRSSRNTHTFDVEYIFLYLWRLFFSQIGSRLSITRLAKRWFTWPQDLSI